MNDGQGKASKNRIVLSTVFLAVAMCLLLLIIRIVFSGETKGDNEEDLKTASESKTVHLFQKIPDIVLTDEAGDKVHPEIPLKNLTSNPSNNLTQNASQSPEQMGADISVLYFWAGDCPYCQEGIRNLDMLAQTAESMGARFFSVVRLDGETETKDQALHILEEHHIQAPPLFDEDRKAYQEIGLSMVPTLLVTDHQGRIIDMAAGSTPSAKQLRNMIAEARDGKAYTFSNRLISLLMNEEGGIRTNYQEADSISSGEEVVSESQSAPSGEEVLSESQSIPSGGDVLSESQGIFMEYAALAGNEELFERLWSYTKSRLFPEGLMPWVISAGTDTRVNALVDDLRIIGALQKAPRIAGENLYQPYVDAVYQYNVEDGKPVDFYDVELGQKADRFTLCYGDLTTLDHIKKNDRRFKEVYDNTVELIQNGRISERFPLYYSYYDYTQQKYEGTRLNMAEAMTTLLHLAEAGQLPEEAMDWIEEEIDKGRVYAAYDIDGSPSADGYYESTSVYALIVMTALAEGRRDIAAKAINMMEQFRVTDAENEFYGIFGNSDGTGIYSFDQGMALLAYEEYERMTE